MVLITATRDFNIDSVLTSLHLIGGNDCNSVSNGDLFVDGGIRIGKTICAEGDIIVDGTVMGDIISTGTSEFSGTVDFLGSTVINFPIGAFVAGTNLGSGANVLANVTGSSIEFRSLVGDPSISITETPTEILFTFTGNLMGNLTGNLLGNVVAPLVCVTGELQTDTIMEKTSGSGITVDGVLIKDGNVTGNIIGDVSGNVTGLLFGQEIHTITRHFVSTSVDHTVGVHTFAAAGGAISLSITGLLNFIGRKYHFITETDFAHTITITGGTFDGTNSTATFLTGFGTGNRLVMIGLTSSRFLIVENLNVSLS